MTRPIDPTILAVSATFILSPFALADDVDPRIDDLLSRVSENVRVYDEHITVLSSPFMEGRLPGTEGMERAKDYMQYYFMQYGLQPAFEIEDSEALSYRQPFELGGTITMHDQALTAAKGDESMEFELGTDFEMTGLGSAGTVTGPVVFVGYSIASGPEDYSSYGEDESLDGKIAVMYRFEPMDEDGNSLWWDQGPWSPNAGFRGKVRAAVSRGAAGVIVVNTPGANDDRVNELMSRAGAVTDDVPVFMMSIDAGSKLLEAGDPNGRNAMQLRWHADAGEGTVDMPGLEVTLSGRLEENPVLAENVAGLLPGRGELADELIVVGAHLDHLGMGDFGSRSGPGRLHPGADDNASGSAAVIMLAQKLAADYEALPEDADARAVLFMGFSAEESGLNGSRYYVENPMVPLERHALMINFDMIGRVSDGEISVSGAGTGEGMEEWLAPIAEASSMNVQVSARPGGGSDHTSFQRRGVPILFGSADIHDDYHTYRDTSDKINREGAAGTVELFHAILNGAALMDDRFTFVEPPRRNRRGGGGGGESNAALMARVNVRVGIRTEATEDGNGLRVLEVVGDTAAAEAGLQSGDVILRWNQTDLTERMDLIRQLAEHEPGDEVDLSVDRDGTEISVIIKLRARE